MIQLFVVANILPVVLYFYNLEYNPIPPEWSVFIKKNCLDLEISDVNVELQNFIHFQFSWAFMGAYLGLIVD